MNMMQDIFSEQFVYSLGWTLLHSLWQGVLIGLLVSLAMVLLHKYTARIRYFINSLSLIVFAALALITFTTYYISYDAQQHDPAAVPQGAELSGTAYYFKAGMQESHHDDVSFSLLDRLAAYSQEHFPLFAMVWLFGVFAMMLRFAGGYALVRRYRHHRVRPVMGEWESRFRDLARRIQVNRNVKLLESALVRVPMAMGYLKPVVLLPLGALNGIPASQMEAILVHELAHIRRKDYLVNLLQSILEAIFFYHPVVWYLSRNVRIEREHICDDIAITITGNNMEFAKALTNIQEINLGSPALAAGLSGKNKHRLVNRIRRIISRPRIYSGFTEGFIAATIMLVSLLGLSAAAMITYPVSEPAQAPELEFTQAGITLPGIIHAPEEVAIPDTLDKKKAAEKEKKQQEQKQKALEQVKAHQKEVREAIQLQMEALKESMKAVDKEIEQYLESDEYKKAFEKIHDEREQYLEQMKQAMKAYKETLKDKFKVDHEVWTSPEIYFKEGEYRIIGDDTLEWTNEWSGKSFLEGDSLHELYLDQFSEHTDHLDELLELKEGQLFSIQENLAELEDLYIPYHEFEFEVPDIDIEYDFDLDHDLDHDQHFHRNWIMHSHPGGIIEEELLDDGLIERGREYIVVIEKKRMLINGEKQPRSIFKKYSRLIESMDESWLHDEDDEYRIHIRR
jgi:beta-lactamase regulating signal transducer with metallopeptidase domain